MDDNVLSYTTDKDYNISKRHMVHKYKAKLDIIENEIADQLRELRQLIENNDTKLNALYNIKGSNIKDYEQYFDIAKRSLEHFAESELDKAELIDKFTHLWYKIGNKFRFYYNNFREDRMLSDREKSGILQTLATSSLDLTFLGDASKTFIYESSLARKAKLQLAFTAATFAQMNAYIKDSPWESLKQLKEETIKPELFKLIDKFIANDMDKQYEDNLDKDSMDLDMVDDSTKKIISQEDYNKILNTCRENIAEEIIMTWNDLANKYFEHNEALTKLKAKFPKIANSTMQAKVDSYLTSIAQEKLAESKYYLNK